MLEYDYLDAFNGNDNGNGYGNGNMAIGDMIRTSMTKTVNCCYDRVFF